MRLQKDRPTLAVLLRRVPANLRHVHPVLATAERLDPRRIPLLPRRRSGKILASDSVQRDEFVTRAPDTEWAQDARVDADARRLLASAHSPVRTQSAPTYAAGDVESSAGTQLRSHAERPAR